MPAVLDAALDILKIKEGNYTLESVQACVFFVVNELGYVDSQYRFLLEEVRTCSLPRVFLLPALEEMIAHLEDQDADLPKEMGAEVSMITAADRAILEAGLYDVIFNDQDIEMNDHDRRIWLRKVIQDVDSFDIGDDGDYEAKNDSYLKLGLRRRNAQGGLQFQAADEAAGGLLYAFKTITVQLDDEGGMDWSKDRVEIFCGSKMECILAAEVASFVMKKFLASGVIRYNRKADTNLKTIGLSWAADVVGQAWRYSPSSCRIDEEFHSGLKKYVFSEVLQEPVWVPFNNAVAQLTHAREFILSCGVITEEFKEKILEDGAKARRNIVRFHVAMLSILKARQVGRAAFKGDPAPKLGRALQAPPMSP
jgi:hypothetical protein